MISPLDCTYKIVKIEVFIYLSITIELQQRSSNDIIFAKFVGNGFQCNLRKTKETGGRSSE